MRAIIDRIEGDQIVLELEDETMVNIPLAGAPAGSREGAVVDYENGTILSVDEIATAERAAKLRARLDRLKKKR